MRYWVILMLITGIFVLTGCGALLKKDDQMRSPAILESQGALKFADVPVPVGFKLLSEDSYTFETAGVRVGVLKYQGKANPDQVVNFYKEQMLMYNWNLVNIVEYGQHLMNFDRENETCIINLLPKGKNISVTISLGPKSQVLPRKAKLKEPVK